VIVVSWAPATFILEMFISLVSRGFQVSCGELYSYLPLKHGAKGPLSFPGIQLLVAQHHPQDFWFKQVSFKVVHWLQFTVSIFNLVEPS